MSWLTTYLVALSITYESHTYLFTLVLILLPGTSDVLGLVNLQPLKMSCPRKEYLHSTKSSKNDGSKKKIKEQQQRNIEAKKIRSLIDCLSTPAIHSKIIDKKLMVEFQHLSPKMYILNPDLFSKIEISHLITAKSKLL